MKALPVPRTRTPDHLYTPSPRTKDSRRLSMHVRSTRKLTVAEGLRIARKVNFDPALLIALVDYVRTRTEDHPQTVPERLAAWWLRREFKKMFEALLEETPSRDFRESLRRTEWFSERWFAKCDRRYHRKNAGTSPKLIRLRCAVGS